MGYSTVVARTVGLKLHGEVGGGGTGVCHWQGVEVETMGLAGRELGGRRDIE